MWLLSMSTTKITVRQLLNDEESAQLLGKSRLEHRQKVRKIFEIDPGLQSLAVFLKSVKS